MASPSTPNRHVPDVYRQLVISFNHYTRTQQIAERCRTDIKKIESKSAAASKRKIKANCSLPNTKLATTEKTKVKAGSNCKSAPTCSAQIGQDAIDSTKDADKPQPFNLLKQYDMDQSMIEKLVLNTRKHPCYEEFYVTKLNKSGCKTLYEIYGENGIDYSNDELSFDILAIDCEMIETIQDNMKLARISVVDHRGKLVLDSLILPCSDPHDIDDIVIDTRQNITGITKQQLKTHAIPFQQARLSFLQLMRRTTTLVGHSLHSDLLALKLKHDFIIDTSMLFPIFNSPSENHFHGLEFLTNNVLKKIMDREGRGYHDSIEDARNSLELVLYLAKYNFGEIHEPIERQNKYDRKFGIAFSIKALKGQAATPTPASKKESSIRKEFKPGNFTDAFKASVRSYKKHRRS